MHQLITKLRSLYNLGHEKFALVRGSEFVSQLVSQLEAKTNMNTWNVD